MRASTIIATLAAAAAIAACGDDSEPAPTTTVTLPSEAATTTPADPEPGAGAPPPQQAEPDAPAETAEADPRINARERAAARTVREYVAALDARDAEAACALLAPGAIDSLPLPEPRGDCPASLAASIGYRDPRGLPVWEGAEVAGAPEVEISAGGDEARVVATVVTTFADRDERSVEDDVVYLVRAGGRWLVAQPSTTLYRAVGIADVPPSVISPPN